jgi:hypothetical protein
MTVPLLPLLIASAALAISPPASPHGIEQASAADTDVQTATASARAVLTAVQQNDSRVLGSYAETGRRVPALMRSLRGAGHGVHRGLANWDGRIKGVSVDGNVAMVWFCTPRNEMLVLMLGRERDRWVAQRIARFRQVR